MLCSSNVCVEKMKVFRTITQVLLLVIGLSSSLYASPIYVYREGGAVKFSTKKPPHGVSAKIFKPGKGRVSTYTSYGRSIRVGNLYKTAFTNYIRQAAQKYAVEPALIRAVIHAESSFNPAAVSPKGAQGLMQLMRTTQHRVGVSDAFSPAQNIDGGTRLLAILLKKYKGNMRLALAAYNAGEGAVAKYGGIPPYQETRHYVDKVLHLTNRYKSALRG